MPIFQDDLEHASTGPLRRDTIAVEPPAPSRQRQPSEESTRTEMTQRRVLDGPIRPTTPRNDEEVMTSDRAELIEMLKRGASPTWIPNRHLESMMQQSQRFIENKSPELSAESSALLLPPIQITLEKAKTNECADERLQDGLAIERPRSALHSGDFTTDETEPEDRRNQTPCRKREERHVAPDIWLATSPPRDFLFDFRGSPHLPQGAGSFNSGVSPLSSSLSTSFVYQPPTSPLVQSETNDELDFPMPLDDMQLLSARKASARRHTLHATTYPSSFASSPSRSPVPPPGFPNRRRERALPYQAHQPRRSLTGCSNFVQQTEKSPQTPAFLRARRLSIGSDTSPLHHASMVGSYEESILRGRMSTTPSRPIDFLAQIGVLGKGKCKPSLRCPPHVTLPFPAVYYCYGTTPHGRSRSDDGPSPYVGQIDLENGLSNPDEESRSRRKTQSRYTERRKACGEADVAMDDLEAESGCCKTLRPRRRSKSPKAPPGGSYRIPEQGQIQIILKNQNKTAVKLFLVPYDLTGMAPGTKTFIRQRSYSTGPIIDVPNNMQADAVDHPILRYLVHLHICCPSKGRYYLYKSIRIVFANRVPDGKEKLRIETTWPDPRFTPYKPIRLMNPPVSTSSGSGAMLVAEKALRRRSLGLPVSASMHPLSTGRGQETPMEPMQSSGFPMAKDKLIPALPPDGSNSDAAPPPPPPPPPPDVTTGTPPPRPASPSHRGAQFPALFDDGAQYEKLNKGDKGYGGNACGGLASGGVPGAGAEGLLSQRLRGLGVKPQPPPFQGE